MTITVNTKAYDFDTNPTSDSAVYRGPANTHAVQDILTLKRVPAKPTASFPGVARSTAKFNRTVTVDSVKYTNVVEVNFSIVLGTSEADVDALRDDMGDLLLLAAADDLVWKHDIVA